MKIARNALAGAGLALLAACDSPLRTCVEESIVATMPAAVTLGAVSQQTELSGRVSEDNVDPATFARLRRVTRDGGSESGAMVFTLDAAGAALPAGSYLAVALRVPVSDGQTLQVRSAFDGGGWGFTTLPAGEEVRVGLQVPGVTLRGLAGTVQVEDAAPLRLRLDLQAVAPTGEAVRLQGTVAFANDDDRVPCS